MQREPSQEIDAEAARWMARIDRAPLTAGENASLERWLAADARHRGAFLRAQAVSMLSEAAAALGPEYDPGAWRPASNRAPESPARRRMLGWGIGIAASLATTALLPLSLAGGRVYATERGEMRMVPLADGSTVTLNTLTRLRVDYDDVRRLVTLLEGEAWFEAALDATRPFVVEAGGRHLSTIGGAFLVRNHPGTPVQVIVRDGKITLPGDRGVAGGVPVLVPNQRASLVPGGERVVGDHVAHDQIARALAWREGKIAFHGESLADAAASFSRYSTLHIVIDDPLLAREPVTGLFTANDPLGFSRAVAGVFDAEVRMLPGKISIERTH